VSLQQTPALRLVVGLGNPGDEYADTRHNIGFKVIDALAHSYSISVTDTHCHALSGQGRIENVDTVLVKPMNFMNRSGPPVLLLIEKYNAQFKDMLVIHDDMDLEFGRIKIKEKGGHGGHNGIRSVMDAVGDNGFARLRIGIGRPEPRDDAVAHVLGAFSNEEQPQLRSLIQQAQDAVITALCKGTKESMNLFNRKTQNQTY